VIYSDTYWFCAKALTLELTIRLLSYLFYEFNGIFPGNYQQLKLAIFSVLGTPVMPVYVPCCHRVFSFALVNESSVQRKIFLAG
jgi:hypothetical protein